MRLIDADDVKKMLFSTFEKEKDVLPNYWVFGTLIDKVDEISTAYDKDEVVGQLHGLKKYSNPYDNYYDNSLHKLTEFENESINEAISDAIKIVKAGGIDEEKK